MQRRIADGDYDVLFPVHDQVFLLAKFRDRFANIGLAVPPFASVRTVQSKPGFARCLDELCLPQPAYQLARTAQELEPRWGFPCFVKAAYSTAGQGVWRAEDRSDLENAAARLTAAGYLNGEKEALVQQPGNGQMCVAQAVFQTGRLVGAHCYRTTSGGVGGSPYVRESVGHPVVIQHLQTLGQSLRWHGALHVEYFFDATNGSVQFIELNPRIGETLNATLAGVNLCELMLQVSRGIKIDELHVSRPGVRSHNLMLRLLGVAQQGLGRRRVLAEMAAAICRRNEYARSQEELMRIADDLPSVLPTAWIALQLLVSPSRVESIVQGAMKGVSLSEAAVQEMIDME